MTGTVHMLFERQACQTPEAVALVYGERQVSYRLLDTLASGIAVALRERGVGPGDVVGILGPRSPEAVAALLGVLRAGGAYTALDSADPDERIRSVISDAGIRVVLCSDGIGASGAHHGVDALDVGGLGEAGVRSDAGVTEDSLAAVIFTSGSSGRPKGVALTHGSLVSRFVGASAHIPTEPRLQKTSFGLIGHVTDLLTPLVHGWPAILIDDRTARNPPALIEAILRHNVHRLFLVPSMLRIFLEVPEIERLRGQIRTLLVSGERLPRELVARVREQFPETTLVHAYGLSETAGTVCHALIGEDGVVTIGRPPHGVVELVNDDLERVLPGETGEIAVSGPTLARGYLNDRDLTARRFRPSPFVPDARICLTGDLGRRLPDGRIEILGRKDREVKLHGLRVNLAEVEHVLERQPEVARAVVVRAGKDDGERGLRAYLTLESGSEGPAAPRLRERLRQTLPGFMVPTAFGVVNALPLLANGKVDLGRLSASDAKPLREEVRVVGQVASPTEAAVAEIWAAELGFVPGETSDDFFALGGDSLGAIRIGLRVRERWGIETTLSDVLEHPRGPDFAAWIDARSGSGENASSTPIRRSSTGAAVTLSVQQVGSLRYELVRPEGGRRNRQAQVRLGLRLVGDLDPVLIEDCVKVVIARHEILRTSYQPEFRTGPIRVEGWAAVRKALAGGRVDPRRMSFRATIHEAAQLEIPVIDLGHVSGDALESELRATISRLVADPFDFGAGPLIRVWLVRTAPREHRLLIVMPHLVADGWSLNILVREVFQFYVARRNGMDPLLPPAVQYADFAEYQRRRQKASVQKTSGSEVPFLEVADLRFLDSESRDVIGLAHDEAESEGTSLDEAFDALRAAAARARVTVSMFVFTCVCMYLYFQSAVSEFRVTITQANRTHPGLEDVFGFVASGQRIRMRFTESSVFASIAEAARREFSDAALRHEIDTAGRPRHGVAFEYNQLRTPSVPGLDVERFRLLARPSADFGLKFRLEERPAGLELCLDYCVDCFKRPVVGSVVHELGKLLDRTIGDPYARVSDLRDCIRPTTHVLEMPRGMRA